MLGYDALVDYAWERLQATRDPLVKPRSADEVRAALPSAGVHVVESCHLLLQTRPHHALARLSRDLEIVTPA